MGADRAKKDENPSRQNEGAERNRGNDGNRSNRKRGNWEVTRGETGGRSNREYQTALVWTKCLQESVSNKELQRKRLEKGRNGLDTEKKSILSRHPIE